MGLAPKTLEEGKTGNLGGQKKKNKKKKKKKKTRKNRVENKVLTVLDKRNRYKEKTGVKIDLAALWNKITQRKRGKENRE